MGREWVRNERASGNSRELTTPYSDCREACGERGERGGCEMRGHPNEDEDCNVWLARVSVMVCVCLCVCMCLSLLIAY